MAIRDKLKDRMSGTSMLTFAQSNWKRVRVRRWITRWGRSLSWRFLPTTIHMEWFLRRRFKRRHMR